MRTEHILYTISLIAALFGIFFMPWWTVDDAYISYEYGKHLAEEGRLVWNQVGTPVEGYSGVLLPLLAALFLKLGIPLVGGIKVLGIGAGLGTALVLRKLLLNLGINRLLASASVLYFLLVPIVYVHALSGLETNIFTFLVLSFLSLVLEVGKGVGKKKVGMWLGLLGIACILTRPEGVVWVGVPLFFLFLNSLQTQQKQIKPILLTSGTILLIFMSLYFYWKHVVYGEILPNTYYAKQFPGTVNLESLKEAAKFIANWVFIPGLASMAFFVGGRKNESSYSTSIKMLFGTVALVFAITMFSYSRSHLFMNYGFRFFYPFLPVFIALAAVGFQLGTKWFLEVKQNHRPGFQLLSVLLVALGVGQMAIHAYRYQTERTFLKNYMAVMDQEWFPAAAYLNETLDPASKVILYQDAGVLSFETAFECVDFGRLNDYYLAHEQPSPVESADYFFSQNADAVVFTSFDFDQFDYHEEGMAIQADPRFSGYRLSKKFTNDRDYPYHQFIYLKDKSGQ